MSSDVIDQVPPTDEDHEDIEAAERSADNALDDVSPEDPPTEAIAGELANTATQRRAENPDVYGVFDGPYDPVKAMRAITTKNREVQASKREWLASKEQTADFKKTYDQDVETLSNLISRYASRSGDAQQQPYLRTVTDEERAAETIDERADRLSVQVARRGWYVTPRELMTLEVFDLDTLDKWVASAAGPIRPGFVVTRSHIAGPAGNGEQHCVRCGARLEAVDMTPYEERALVGLYCPGDDLDRMPPPVTKKRGTRKQAKHNPDVEQTRQKAEGAKRAKKTAHTTPRKRR